MQYHSQFDSYQRARGGRAIQREVAARHPGYICVGCNFITKKNRKNTAPILFQKTRYRVPVPSQSVSQSAVTVSQSECRHSQSVRVPGWVCAFLGRFRGDCIWQTVSISGDSCIWAENRDRKGVRGTEIGKLDLNPPTRQTRFLHCFGGVLHPKIRPG